MSTLRTVNWEQLRKIRSVNRLDSRSEAASPARSLLLRARQEEVSLMCASWEAAPCSAGCCRSAVALVWRCELHLALSSMYQQRQRKGCNDVLACKLPIQLQLNVRRPLEQ